MSTNTGTDTQTSAGTPATMTARPTPTASVLALCAAAGTLSVLGVSLVPVLLELGSLLVVAGGLALRRRRLPVLGLAVAVAGFAGCLGAIGLAATGADGTSELLWVVPGVLGVTVLGLAILPLRGSGSRWLVKAGAGGVLLSVALAGLFRASPLGTLLLAMVGTVLAWDAGEHAIDAGRQLGRSTATWRLDVAHVGSTAVVGLGGVVIGHAVAGMQAGALTLHSYALLFVALLALTLALHR